MRNALLALLFCIPPLHAAELTLDLPGGSRTWETGALLAHPQAREVTIPDDVSYKKTMRYRAIPLAALLEGVTPEQHLQAVALDGFAAELTAAPLLAKDGSRAWLAIEDPASPWPPLAAGWGEVRVRSPRRRQATGSPACGRLAGAKPRPRRTACAASALQPSSSSAWSESSMPPPCLTPPRSSSSSRSSCSMGAA